MPRLTAPCVLVLDGAEYVSAADAARLIELLALTRRFRLIVSGRAVDHFVQASRSGSQGVDMIGAHELGLTRSEVAELLAASRISLPSHACEDVDRELSGWPGAVSAFISAYANTSPDPSRFTTGLAAGRAYVRQVIGGEITRADDVTHLVALSVKADFTRESAEAITADVEVMQLIRRMVSLGWMAERLDGSERIFCWQAAARRVFSEQLAQQSTEYVRTLDTRLMRHYLHRADFGRALDHATRAADWGAVVSLIEQDWYQILLSRPRSLAEAFQALPSTCVRDNPTVLAVYAGFST